MAAKRDSKGRFIKGHTGNPGGRPKDTVSAEIRAAITSKMTPDKVDALVDKLIDQAVAGDDKARKQLMAFFNIDLDKVVLEHSGGVEITVKYVRQGDKA